MPSEADLIHAKQLLSGRLLRQRLRGVDVLTSSSLRVDDAIRTAGQNVHAVGIGRKSLNGVLLNDLCVRVYVVQKIAESLLPPLYRIPKEIDGVATDVIESPPAFIQARKKADPATTSANSAPPTCSQNRRARQRPIIAGISSGHFRITAGTIAYFCRSTKHGDDPSDIFVLSNNHVYADVDNGVPGDDIYQPGTADGGTVSDRIADLVRWVPIQLRGLLPNRVDAAIGKLLPEIQHRLEICSIGAISGTITAIEDMVVRKHGRTSGYTEGTVTDVAYDALVGMDHNDPSVVALFQNQIRVESLPAYPAFALGGDSGSLIVEKDHLNAVGLYFAGPESGFYGVANHIDDVLTLLQIQLL